MAFRIIFIAVAMGFLSFVCGCSKPEPAAIDPQKPVQTFAELSHQDTTRLDEQRAVVSAVAKQRYGTAALTKSKADLRILQRLLDDQVFSPNQTYELQCLGVVFGDVVASELPLRWIIVTDQDGTDPTLANKDKTIQINALTMLSKRLEDGDKVNVTELLEGTLDTVSDIEKEQRK